LASNRLEFTAWVESKLLPSEFPPLIPPAAHETLWWKFVCTSTVFFLLLLAFVENVGAIFYARDWVHCLRKSDALKVAGTPVTGRRQDTPIGAIDPSPIHTHLPFAFEFEGHV
jgi:hypothetical protein